MYDAWLETAINLHLSLYALTTLLEGDNPGFWFLLLMPQVTENHQPKTDYIQSVSSQISSILWMQPNYPLIEFPKSKVKYKKMHLKIQEI